MVCLPLPTQVPSTSEYDPERSGCLNDERSTCDDAFIGRSLPLRTLPYQQQQLGYNTPAPKTTAPLPPVGTADGTTSSHHSSFAVSPDIGCTRNNPNAATHILDHYYCSKDMSLDVSRYYCPLRCASFGICTSILHTL